MHHLAKSELKIFYITQTGFRNRWIGRIEKNPTKQRRMGLYDKSVIAFTKSNFLIQLWVQMLTSAHSTILSEEKAFFLCWQNLIW